MMLVPLCSGCRNREIDIDSCTILGGSWLLAERPVAALRSASPNMSGVKSFADDLNGKGVLYAVEWSCYYDLLRLGPASTICSASAECSLLRIFVRLYWVNSVICTCLV